MRYLIFAIVLIVLCCENKPEFVEPAALRTIPGQTWRLWNLNDSSFALMSQDTSNNLESMVRSDSLRAWILTFASQGGGSFNDTLYLSNDTLFNRGGDFVVLDSYLDNTDAQTLSLLGNNLSISNGNSVDLSGLGGGGSISTDTLYVVISGQSNAQGTTDSFQGDTTSSDSVEIWDYTDNSWKKAEIGQTPFRVLGNNNAGAQYNNSNNFGLHFSRRLSEETGNYVRMIISHTDGMAIDYWTQGVKAGLDSIDSKITAAGVDEVDVFLWHQGEGDNGELESYYISNFDTLKKDLRAFPWFPTTTPIIVGGLLLTGTSPEMDVALRRLESSGADSWVAYARSNDLVNNGLDNVHFSGSSLVELGYNRYWAAYQSLPHGLSAETYWFPQDFNANNAINEIGNIGLGVSSVSALTRMEIASNEVTQSALKIGSFEFQTTAQTDAAWIFNNLYYDGSFRYRATGNGLAFVAAFDDWSWRTAPSGSAGAAATLTERMRLTEEGELWVGYVFDNGAFNLQVNGNSFLNGEVNIGSATDQGAYDLQVDGDSHFGGQVEINTTTGAVLLPRLTTTERNALTGAVGMVLYNTTVDSLQVNNGTNWLNILTGPSS